MLQSERALCTCGLSRVLAVLHVLKLHVLHAHVVHITRPTTLSAQVSSAELTTMHRDLPARQKSQRLVEKARADQRPGQYFFQYKQKAKNISNANELLPGLNDILDAFEALPMDLVRYFTLLKEIDAKCINLVPTINRQITSYIEQLHLDNKDDAMPREAKLHQLNLVRRRIFDVIPCLEEKMHVASVASDVLAKHMYRIKNDYNVIVGNNEIPELVRLGPLNHRAMVQDPQLAAEAAKLAQSQRSESRREALAARKANKDDDDDPKRRRNGKELTPVDNGVNVKKRRNDDRTVAAPDKKRAVGKPKKEREDETGAGAKVGPGSGGSGEPTYCYCNQVSFGEMVGCDGDNCKREWFHLPCIGFKNPPKGKWYCDECLAKMKKQKK